MKEKFIDKYNKEKNTNQLTRNLKRLRNMLKEHISISKILINKLLTYNLMNSGQTLPNTLWKMKDLFKNFFLKVLSTLH
jgi:thioredoxin-related protein